MLKLNVASQRKSSMLNRSMKIPNAVVAIVGSGLSHNLPASWQLQAIEISTPWGDVTLHQYARSDRPAYLLFRHGIPHRWLPNQIPYKAHAWAIRAAGCGALLATSSVGVLDAALPLNTLLDVHDIVMLDNRLPDGSACTIYDAPSEYQGHLVLKDGLLSGKLRSQLQDLLAREDTTENIAEDTAENTVLEGPVTFAYAGGPRTKTGEENRIWRSLGADVNSMTLAPEIVLANELGIPCAAIVVGHKYSLVEEEMPGSDGSLSVSLDESGALLARVVTLFLEQGRPVPFGNLVYRFHS